MTNIQTIAGEARDYFQTHPREASAPVTTVYTLRDDAPEWVREAVREAHDLFDIMPDDLTYELCADAFAAVSGYASGFWDDDAHDFADSEVSVYTSARMAYISDSWHRRSAADDALAEGIAATIEDAAAAAWYAEAEAVYGIIRSAVKRATADEGEGE